jgi:hypothetical protein
VGSTDDCARRIDDGLTTQVVPKGEVNEGSPKVTRYSGRGVDSARRGPRPGSQAPINHLDPASFADAVGERCTIRTETTWEGVRGRGWMIAIRELNDGVATGRTQSLTIERVSTQPWGAVWGVDAGSFTYEATLFESTSHGDRAVATRTSGVVICPAV